MTALVPTKGHIELIKFASNIANEVAVLIQGRTFEPISIDSRYDGILEEIKKYSDNVKVIAWTNDDAPQVPDPSKETTPGADTTFWLHWRDEILKQVDVGGDDVIVASEHYGSVLADYLNCSFMPFDIAREFFPIKGADVREDVYKNWDKIAPAFRKYLTYNFVMFGQESVGKTTLAKKLASHINGLYVPEYARGYLETVGSELSLSKMEHIARGQMALEKSALENPDYSVRVFDTDILSTIGYYRIYNGNYKPTEIERYLYDHFVATESYKIYILLPDNIPFEPDSLRYGGDKRESTYQFWKDLLDEFGCEYYEANDIKALYGSALDRTLTMGRLIEHTQSLLANRIRNFKRET